MSNSQNGEMDAATLDEQHAQTELLQSIERRLELPIPVRVQEPIRVTVDKVSKTSLADGAATEAKQDVGNTSLASIDTKLTNPIPVTVGALPLPAGAATAARQDTGNASLASIDAGIPAALGQTTMANSMPVTLASDQTSVPVTVASNHSSRSDTYVAVASGVTVSLTKPLKSFSIQVKSTTAVATTWTIVLEGSLDGTNFETILTHKKATGDGAVLFSGAVLSPVLYFRSRATAVTLGPATNLVTTILGME